jgi:hypothetical protein
MHQDDNDKTPCKFSYSKLPMFLLTGYIRLQFVMYCPLIILILKMTVAQQYVIFSIRPVIIFFYFRQSVCPTALPCKPVTLYTFNDSFI